MSASFIDKHFLLQIELWMSRINNYIHITLIHSLLPHLKSFGSRYVSGLLLILFEVDTEIIIFS